MTGTWRDALTDPGPWKRLPGTSRQYKSASTGLVLPDRQYRKFREFMGERATFTKTRLVQQREKQEVYNHRLKNYVQYQNTIGKKVTKGEARKSPEFKRISRELTDLNRVVGYDKKGKAIRLRDTPEGRLKLRDDLIALGRRQGIPSWVPPGLSDAWKKGNLRPSRIAKKWQMAQTNKA